MRLIDADKIEYYPVDRNGKHIGEMVWKPHIDGIETFNLEEHDKKLLDKMAEKIDKALTDDDSVYKEISSEWDKGTFMGCVLSVIKDMKAEVNKNE